MAELRPPALPRRHLLSIGDLERADVERILETAQSLAASIDREMKKLPTLRGRTVVNLFYESSTRTLCELRARREAALGRHDVASLVRVVRRQGRVAEGHSTDARGVRAGRHRRPSSVDRRTPARRASHGCARRERGRREASTSDTGPPRPLHDARRSRPARGSPRRDRGRRPPLEGCPLARPGARARRRSDAHSSARRRSFLAASRRSAATSRTTSRRSRMRTSCTSCACSTSAWGRRSCRPCASTPRSTASRPHACGQGRS